MTLKILELFAGTRSIGKAFEKHGHDVTSIDIDPKFEDCIIADAYDYLLEHGEDGYDVIWASPCCTTYSVAGISVHRLKASNGRFVIPKDDYALECDINNTKMFNWFNNHRNILWFIENPRGNLQHMEFAVQIEDLKTELCYCQYGFPTMKPTNIWTTHKNPKWKPMCHPGASHHPKDKCAFENMFRGKYRSAIPKELCEHIVKICEGEGS